MRRRLVLVVLLTVGAPSLFSRVAGAATLTVEPGKWEITSTITSTHSPQPQTRTSTECITTHELDPFEAIAKGKGCQVADVKKTGNSVSGMIACEMGPGMPPMLGTVETTVTGDTMKRYMKLESPQFTQEMHSEGKRVGECDE